MKSSSIFSEPGYSYLIANRSISSIILWADFTLIFSLLSYHFEVDATTIGLISALYGLPALLFGPYFGALADQKRPTSIIFIGYLARGVISFSLVFCGNIYIFIALIFAKGISNLGSQPAEQVIIRSILSNEQLVDNARILTIIDQVTKVIAPLFGAALATLYFPSFGFALSGTLSVIGLLITSRMREHIFESTPKKSTNSATRRISALLLLINGNITFRISFVVTIAQTFVLSLYDPLLALFLKDGGMPTGTFGSIVSSTAIGSILGAALFRRLFSRNAKKLATFSLIIFGLTVFIPGLLFSTGLTIVAPMLLALWTINGCCYGLTSMSFGVTMQQECPKENIGTISATFRSLQLAILVSGPLAGAALAKLFSIPLVFLGSGGVAILLGILIWMFLLKIRKCQ